MLETNDSNALDFIDEFRKNLFVEEVIVFTPKGDLKILPDKATALDFAFDIHTQIGMQCIGAKVNQKLVPLSYKLHNGDQIEILTSKKQCPTEEWLKFATTSKARSKIKEYLREDKKQKIELGRQMVAKRFEQLGIDNSIVNQNWIYNYFNILHPQEFYYRVALGKVDVKDIDNSIFDPESENFKAEVAVPHNFEKEVQKIRGVSSDMLVIGEKTSKIDYKIATCCNPIPGDDVFGFETEQDGISIHRTSCPKAVELMSNYGNRIVKAKWTDQYELAFLAGIRMKGTDRVGMVNDLTKVISNSLKVNMRSITLDSQDGVFDGKIMVFVHDTSHLEKLIQKLQRVKGVLLVERFDS
jgi:GTP pyrophosphokinase